MRTIIGITGASGAILGVEFAKRLPGEKYVVFSKWGQMVLKEETGLSPADLGPHVDGIFSDADLANPLASGSNPYDAVVIVPCSVTTLGKIASGIGDTLLTRTAYVAMKERRRLVLALRETPLATVSLKQAYELSQDGVIIMPTCPPFYMEPKTLQDAIDGFVDKLLGVLGCAAAEGYKTHRLDTVSGTGA
ncbi:MAG: UbiX family flavin prenyltransferase [Candidatus Omnitrophica bacterium]|nr:UbiX family flavin prenyltransferase [Candidatus Omnitrophota bacterium]